LCNPTINNHKKTLSDHSTIKNQVYVHKAKDMPYAQHPARGSKTGNTFSYLQSHCDNIQATKITFQANYD